MSPRPVKIGYASGQKATRPQKAGSSKKPERDISELIKPFPRFEPRSETPKSGSSSFLPPRTPPPPPRFTPIPAADYANMVLNQAKVKSVLSGDSFILCSVGKPELERILSLAYCTSPHLKKEGDELFAFESREALRKMCVGKHIQFTVLYKIPNTNREYGLVYLNDGLSLPDEMVREGWLKLREDAGKKEDSEKALEHLDKLRKLEAEARSDKKGLWQSGGKIVQVQHTLDDPPAFLETWKGKTVDGIVERILAGDRILVRYLIAPAKHIQALTVIAGLRSPANTEEFGDEARLFLEERILQRNVEVDILGLSTQNHLVASIKHPRGSIALFLLEAGLARCVDHHSTLLATDMAALRQAEQKAKSAKLKLFKDFVAKPTTQGGSIEAQVTRVHTADVIIVRTKSGEEKRINLSSIRGPRTNEDSEAPFRDDAKEFLRKKLIGKHVRMSIDGSRPAAGEYGAKEVATVIFNDKNINLILVQEGWCSVVRHKKDDTDRAPKYDELLLAQEKAKEEKKGMWSGKPPKFKQFTDASENLRSSKLQLPSLQRQKKIPAIVDFVKGGSRFTILIPRESIKMTFVLAGIRAPKAPRNADDKGDPYGQESYDFAMKRLNQRNVEINVQNIEKVGGFIGELYIGNESFAKLLVEEGLATVYYSADQSGSELAAAEQRAKDARRAIWTNWDPSWDQEEDAEPTNGANQDVQIPRAKDYRDVMITNIDENGKMKLQILGTGTSALETMMKAFRSFHINPSNSAGLPGPPKAGDYVAAKFTEDGEWYRARIRSNDRTDKEAEIVYIDYGNSEKLPWSSLRPLSRAQFSAQTLCPQAIDAVLSLLQFPTNKDYLDDAISCLRELTEGLELVANVDYTAPDTGILHVTLYDQRTSQTAFDSINAEVIRDGHAMVPRKLTAWEKFADVLKSLREKEALAKEERRGMWEYGDLTED